MATRVISNFRTRRVYPKLELSPTTLKYKTLRFSFFKPRIQQKQQYPPKIKVNSIVFTSTMLKFPKTYTFVSEEIIKSNEKTK
mmetsp:Transcript_9963/g.10268  ORF Transcript_9963/g.10268 Transcript_9963/m.10268 type:complete len:83 (+) Transcript_9963:594-842(+)